MKMYVEGLKLIEEIAYISNHNKKIEIYEVKNNVVIWKFNTEQIYNLDILKNKKFTAGNQEVNCNTLI